MSMNPRKRDQLIYIRTNYTGFIPELGTAGPIVSPMLCPISRCVKMMSNGVKLFEVDPKSGKTVELTVSNIDNPNNFGDADEVPEKFNVDKPVMVQTHTETPAEEPVTDDLEDVVDDEGEAPAEIPETPVEETEDADATPAEETKGDESVATEDSQLPSNPKMTKAQKKAAKAAKAAAEATK